MFDIFIASYLPNKHTPRIVIQLRSLGLWTDGVKEMINSSCMALKYFLDDYGVKIIELKENRIDYAYHTNMIQNITKYFSDDNLLKSLKTSLTIYHKVGSIGRKIEIDYLSLGNRKSNNVFFRAYNKTREVVEKNYKGLFIEIWYKNKLISNYDKFVLEYAYHHGTYNGLILGRCEWYLQFGKDEKLKKTITKLINTCNINSDNISHIADVIKGILPEVTQIINIEFQTKRKFYMTCASCLESYNCSVLKSSLYYRMFLILDNRKSILDYLTSQCVAFKTGDEFSSWWSRIRSLRLDNYTPDSLFYRQYIRNLDLDKLTKRTVSAIASNSIYSNGCNDNGFSADFSDLICTLNDNDVSAVLVDSNTGSLLDLDYNKYDKIKRRKNRQLKSIVDDDIKI